MVLGGFGQFEELVLGPILCTNPVLPVELAEVIEVVNVITDALPPNNRLDTGRTKNRFRAVPHHQPPLLELVDIDGLARSEQRWGRERVTWDPESSNPHFSEGWYEGGQLFPVDSSIVGVPLKPL